MFHEIQQSDSAAAWTFDPAIAELNTLWEQVIRMTPLVALGLVVLVVSVAVAGIVTRMVRRPLRRRVKSVLVRGVIEKMLFALVLVAGAYVALRISGLTSFAVTLVGSTGLVGLIVGFAFRDIAENFLASILLSVQRPFYIGDTIEVDGHTGVVQKVTTRGTILMDFDGNHIQIANATVYKSTIRNFTANPKQRLGFVVGIGFDAGISRAQKVALSVMEQHSAILQDPEPLVLVEQLGSATINLRIYGWIDGNKHSRPKVRSSLMRLVVRAFEEAGVSMPDEARELVFPQPVPVRMLAEGEPAQPAAAASRHVEEEVSDAEGDLSSEVDELKEQALESRDPDAGGDIMGEDSEEN